MNLRRKIIKWSIIIFIIVASGGAILNSILSKRINRDFIVGLLESEKNIRVDVMEVTPSVISGRINLEEVLIGPRDADADSGVLISERIKPSPSKTKLAIKNISLKINLLDYVFGKLSIRSLIVEDLNLSYSINGDGNHSLDPLMDPPEYIRGKINPEYELSLIHI